MSHEELPQEVRSDLSSALDQPVLPEEPPAPLVERLGGAFAAAVTFAGQGNDALAELEAVLEACPAAGWLLREGSRCLEALAEREEFRFSGLVEQGFAVEDWVRSRAGRPEASYVGSTLVSQPLLFLAQCARWTLLRERGLAAALRRGGVAVLTGHSQGVMPAVFVSECGEGPLERERFLELLRYMAWQGLHMAQSSPLVPEGEGTPMAAVTGLTAQRLEALCDRLFAGASALEKPHLTLHNTRTRLVLSGPPAALRRVRGALEELAAREKELHRAGRLGGRPSQARWEWLAVGGAFHSPAMAAGRSQMERTLAREGLRFDARALRIPVLDPADGGRLDRAEDLAQALLASQFVRPVRWSDTVRAALAMERVRCVLDAGPGDGVARLTRSLARGAGKPVLALTTAEGEEELCTAGAAPPEGVRYEGFLPSLTRLKGGEVVLRNRYTEATGHAPFVLPGMTPTTAEVPLVAAAAKAGLTAELAGGGQPTEAILRERLAELAESLPPGAAVTFNALYLDRYLWDLQLGARGLVLEAARAGAPLCGVTVSAGVPPVEEGAELLDRLVQSGLWLNAFKPGTVAQLEQVLKIAAARPEHTVFVHLEGGQAGGHHSWEELDALLLDCYPLVRAQPNVVLCVGGGVGVESRAWELLSGRWALAHGEPRMPVDAVLLGTVAMVCDEAATSPQVKRALVEAAGTARWVLAGEVEGGVTSGKSPLGADIHYLDNAASRAGRLLDEVAGDEEALARRKEELVAALAKTARPYFGDVRAMSYRAVLRRMVELLALGRHGRYEDGAWLDRSWRERVADFVRLLESRLAEAPCESLVDPALRALEVPAELLARVDARYPQAASVTMHPADVGAFVHGICARPGKPVPFVPALEGDLRRWYKADSLWHAHDERFAADAVLALPGPAALVGVRACEPVAALFARFEGYAVQRLLEEGAVAEARERRYAPRGVAGLRVRREGERLVLSRGAQGAGDPLAWAARRFEGAVAELCGARFGSEGGRRVRNPLRALCAWEAGAELHLEVSADGRALRSVRWTPGRGRDEVELREEGEGARLTLWSQGSSGAAPRGVYAVRLEVGPAYGPPSFVVEAGEATRALTELYARALFGEEVQPVGLFEEAVEPFALSGEAARAYAAVTAYGATGAPPHAVFSLAWRCLFRALLTPELAGGLLHLVHLEQGVRWLAAEPPAAGLRGIVRARVTRVEEESAGRTAEVRATLEGAAGEALAELSSRFYLRRPEGPLGTVRACEPFCAELRLRGEAERGLLRGLEGLTLAAPLEEAGEAVCFRGVLREERRRGAEAIFEAQGEFLAGTRAVGALRGRWSGGERHPVRVLAELLGEGAEVPARETPSRTVCSAVLRAPASMGAFAEAGGDRNPLHTSDAAARLAGLPRALVHGMWTSARAQSLVAEHAGQGEGARLGSWDARFVAPLYPGEVLSVSARRVRVEGGARVLEVSASAKRGEAEVPVLRATAKVAPPRTAYLFPGQGIQQRGMGLAALERSAAARAVWERADACTRASLGFSILQVVRENPRELVVDGERLAHPEGVLHLTRFTQPAMAVLAMAQVAELREAGVYVEGAVACGHSVGEYNALAAVVGVLPLEAVVPIVYQRGCVMHRFVPRDARGASAYRMGVLRPVRAGLRQLQALELVDEVARRTGRFLQVVNFNVRDRQYAVTGEREALEALAKELTRREKSREKPAWAEVPGVDVPFHSSVLREGVPAFRETLERCLPARFEPARLVGRYVPNLVAEVFSLEKSFVEKVAATSASPVLARVLAHFEASARDEGALARTLLVELLAYQFASPVRWIETQELLLAPRASGGLGVERFVEVGVGYQPTVANMLRSTLEGLGASAPRARVLNAERDRGELFEEDEDPAPPVVAPSASAKVEARVEAPAVSAARAAVAPEARDARCEHGTALRALVALQARVRPEQLSEAETLDAVFEGVSSRRNQALLDVGSEFGLGALEGAQEKPLAKLGVELAARAGRYAHPGPYLRAAQEEALRRVLSRAGIGRKEACAFWEREFGLGAGLQGQALDVLALESRAGSSTRGGPLGALAGAEAQDRAAGEAVLEKVVELLGARRGERFARRAEASGGGAVDAAAVLALREEVLGEGGALSSLAKGLLASLGHAVESAPREGAEAALRAQRERVEREHGAGYLALLEPVFSAEKHTSFAGAEHFARRDVARAFFDARAGRRWQGALGRLALFSSSAGVRETARWYALRAEDDALRSALHAVASGVGASPAEVRSTRPEVRVEEDGALRYGEVPDASAPTLARFHEGLGDAACVEPRARESWLAVRARAACGPMDFAGRTAVVSGASPGSIAVETVRHLLRGGARVVVTCSALDRARRRFYRVLYRAEAGPGAELHVVPCNMASYADIDALVQWLFAPATETVGAAVVQRKEPFAPDLVLPFGAVRDLATLDRLDARSLVALRVQLLGVERLVTALAARYRAQGLPARRCHVVLPLSPNHGGFGGDGAYAESKAALEVLLERWSSEREAWGHAVTLCGARIGWVRGTGLMDANNAVAPGLEQRCGVRTFSAAEMGWLLSTLCADEVRAHAVEKPLRAELTGGMERVGSLREVVGEARAALDALSREGKRAATLRAEWAKARGETLPPRVAPRPAWPLREPRAQRVAWPASRALLEKMVVVVGRAELGPCGTGRTRFELEVSEELSPAAVLELAWLTGLVRWEKEGAGCWVDGATGERVPEDALHGRYHEAVRSRVGLRFVEPGSVGYDPASMPVHASVVLERELDFAVGSKEEAEAFVAADPERTRARFEERRGEWRVVRAAGTELKVQRRAKLSARVAGALPEGFDARRFGLDEDLCSRVDPVGLYNLLATVDAFVSAGLEPEELLAHLHPARVANTQGAGIGGMASLRRLYQDHLLGAARQKDVLQETLINVAAAYVVQSYVGSYGAMAHPVGACATAAVSLEEGADKLLLGKADFVVAGGYDDIGREGAVGFADMGATADTDALLARGLEPAEFSRANDARRAGFVEAQGGGTVLLTRGDVALKLGLPVHGVLAYAGSFGDGIQQSVPAPGLGALAAGLGGRRSPLALALAEHGLDADDVALVYKHDTSTTANDLNENVLHQRLQEALGRSAGNPLFVVSQKSLTGHSKGGAAAWQLGGLCDALAAGVVPGNRNLDTVDPAMAQAPHLCFTDETLRPGEGAPLRAGLLTSLGFGHVSALVLVLHPEAFLARVPEGERAAYEARVEERARWTRERRAAVLLGKEAHFRKRSQRRFVAPDGSAAQRAEEASLLLDEGARLDPRTGRFVAGAGA